MNDLKAAVDRLAENLRDAEETINDRTVRSMVQDEARKNIPAFSTALAALREKQQREKGCRYCEWIDITQAHEDEDGPLNYCRACGRKLTQSG